METTKYFWTVESELIICIQLVVNVLLLFTPLNRYMMTSLGPVIHIWPLAKHRITYLINILLIRNNLIGGGGVKKEFQHSPQNQSISRFDNFSSYLMINTNEPKSTYVSDSFTNRSINDSMIDNFSPGDERRKFFRKYFIFHVDFIFSFSGAWAFKRLLGWVF